MSKTHFDHGHRQGKAYNAQYNSAQENVSETQTDSIAGERHTELAHTPTIDRPNRALVLPPSGSHAQQEVASSDPVSRGVTTVNDGNAVDEPEQSTTGDCISSPSSDDQSPSTHRVRYAEAASAPGPWQQKESRRTKRRTYRDERDRHARGKTTNPGGGHAGRQHGSLKGASQEQLSALYVRNIEISDDDTDESIVDNVRRYCQTKGVKALRANVIYNRYNDYVVGCKVSVVNSQKHKLLADNFWPNNITCREWNKSGAVNSRRDVTSYDKDTDTLSRTVTNIANDTSTLSKRSWGSQDDILIIGS